MARTQSREAHGKVLSAALKLVAERGVEAASMDAIASEAGVSKATVYKHWKNKDQLLLEVIGGLMDKLPEFESDDPREDMIRLLRHMAQSRKREELGRIWPRVIGYAVANPEFARALQYNAFAPRREQIRRILSRAAGLRRLKAGIDPEFAMDLLVGPIFHRRFSCQDKVPEDLPELIVDYFWKVFRRV